MCAGSAMSAALPATLVGPRSNREDFIPGRADEARLNQWRPSGHALGSSRMRCLDQARLVLS